MKKQWGWTAINCLIRIRFPHIHQINPSELADWLAQDNQPYPVLLDARSPAEYAVSHLKGAYLIREPWESLEFEGLDQKQNLTHDIPIVVYCSIGYRSALRVEQLQKMGYSQAINLKGSIFHWAAQDYLVYRGEQAVKQLHPYNQWWRCWLNWTIPKYQFIEYN